MLLSHGKKMDSPVLFQWIMNRQKREKKGSPASPDTSNGFIPQLIDELLKLNPGKQGSITPHVQKEGRCFDSPLCRCLIRKGWQS